MAPAPQFSTEVVNKIAQALVDFRFKGPSHGNEKLMVMADGVVNVPRVNEEYNKIIKTGPNAIRWAHKNKKLNLTKVDARLVDEVVNRPKLPATVKERVREILKERVKRIQGGDSDDED